MSEQIVSNAVVKLVRNWVHSELRMNCMYRFILPYYLMMNNKNASCTSCVTRNSSSLRMKMLKPKFCVNCMHSLKKRRLSKTQVRNGICHYLFEHCNDKELNATKSQLYKAWTDILFFYYTISVSTSINVDLFKQKNFIRIWTTHARFNMFNIIPKN